MAEAQSAFFWSYAILQMPVGMVLDRFGVTTVSRIGAFLWGVASGVVALATGFGFDLRRAGPARRRGSASLSGQLQGDRLLVPARRARAGDGDLRRGGEVLQRHRRAAGGGRRRDLRLALGLRPDGDPELRLLRRLLVHLSRSERRHEAQPRGARLHPQGRRDARRRPPRRARSRCSATSCATARLGADHRLRGLRLFVSTCSSPGCRAIWCQEMHMSIIKSAGYAAIPWLCATISDLVVGGWLVDQLDREGLRRHAGRARRCWSAA